MKRGTAMADKMVAVFSEKDCDKLAANISSFLDTNKPEIAALDAWEKGHDADKKALDKQSDAKMKEFQKSVGPILDKCKGNKALDDALAKMPQD
jgi:hypothetical protein